METVLSQWFNVNISLLHFLSFLVSFSHNSEPLSLCVHYLVISISHQLFWFLNPRIDTIIIIIITITIATKHRITAIISNFCLSIHLYVRPNPPVLNGKGHPVMHACSLVPGPFLQFTIQYATRSG